MLAEVQQTVDDVVIITKGRLVLAAPLAELAATSGPAVAVRSPDGPGLRRLVEAQGWAIAPPDAASTGSSDGFVLVQAVTPAEVGAAAFAAGLELHELSRRDVGLERTFLDLTETEATP